MLNHPVMSTAVPLPLSDVPAPERRARVGRPQPVRAGQRQYRRTSLLLRTEDELLLDALRDDMDGLGIAEVIRTGLRELATSRGLDVNDLTKERAAAA